MTSPTPTARTEVGVTWIGHATARLDMGGMRVLTDPLLTKRVAHLRRRRPLDAATFADIDLVLLSHLHMDHLHVPSLRASWATTRRSWSRPAPATSCDDEGS